MNYILLIAGLFGLSGILLGAFGEHTLEGHLSAADWQSFITALRYHQLYAVLLLVLAGFCWLPLLERGQNWLRGIAGLFSLGTLLFCGGIYFRIFSGINDFGWLIPVGGTVLIVAWLGIVLFALKYRVNNQ